MPEPDAVRYRRTSSFVPMSMLRKRKYKLLVSRKWRFKQLGYDMFVDMLNDLFHFKFII